MSMPKRNTIHHRDAASIPFGELKAALPLFPTKKAALVAGKEYGWRDAVRLIDRFETVWVVGQQMLQPDETAGIRREHFRFPLLRWERQDGVAGCPVLDVFVVSEQETVVEQLGAGDECSC